MDYEIKERYELSSARIKEICGEECLEKAYSAYFQNVAALLRDIIDVCDKKNSGALEKMSYAELKALNGKLYAPVIGDNYNTCYGNPDYTRKTVTVLSKELAAIYAEMFYLIPAAYEADVYKLTLYLELFLEVYSAFCCSAAENKLPDRATIKSIIYSFCYDNISTEVPKRIKRTVVADADYNAKFMKESYLDKKVLFLNGFYICEDTEKTFDYIAKLSDEKINGLAKTLVDGYVTGFELANKPLDKKKYVSVHFPVGFERVIKRVCELIEERKLSPVIVPSSRGMLSMIGGGAGFSSHSANRQFNFDHRNDRALFVNKTFVNKLLRVVQEGYSAIEDEAKLVAGPAVLEDFGWEDFDPESKKTVISMTAAQNKLTAMLMGKYGRIVRQFINYEERSFTIMALPVYAINPEKYGEVFDKIVEINTLDMETYKTIQQNLIDALDGCDYALIKGKNNNRTDLKVKIKQLDCPEKETAFENCLADVNIPVGEIFTSPVLKGTEGVLFVGHVFINGLEFKNLWFEIHDGFVTDFGCENFDNPAENKKIISENIMFRYDRLPMGEFAIGTNTLAYMTAKKYGIESKFPILIAEKTGPHFAFGDTCYSNSEDVKVYNPNGKEIVAKENDCSLKRHTNPEEAYFSCHTDITIPYDELGLIEAHYADGSVIKLIEDSKFVLPGTEKLNEVFE